jgi:hypothetical protein
MSELPPDDEPTPPLTVAEAALDYAATLIAEAAGVSVDRTGIPDDPDFDDDSGTGLVAALATGTWTETGYLISAAKPYEFEHAAPFQVVVFGDDQAERSARRAAYVRAAHDAIADDPTLGGLVDHAELGLPDPADEERFTGLAAVLTLTFTAPDALG